MRRPAAAPNLNDQGGQPYAAFYQNLHIGYALCGMLDFCVAQGVQAVEIGTGNWSGAPHIDLDELLGSETARQRWMDQLRRRGYRPVPP